MKPRPRLVRRLTHISLPLRPVRSAAIAAIVAATIVGCGSTTAHTSTGSPTLMARPTAPSSPAFTAFAGQWYGHGSYLVIRPDGGFAMTMRTYRFCGQDPPPCDKFSGNTITAGDVATGKLTSVSGEVATGEVTHTTDQAQSPTGRITMTLDPATDTISAGNVSFCGPSAPNGNCGA